MRKFLLVAGSLWLGTAVPGSAGVTSFVHVATAGNTVDDQTCMSHPAIDDRQDAILVVTQSFEPADDDGPAPPVPLAANDHPVGLFYNLFTGRHFLINEDRADMTVGASTTMTL